MICELQTIHDSEMFGEGGGDTQFFSFKNRCVSVSPFFCDISSFDDGSYTTGEHFFLLDMIDSLAASLG